MRIKKTAQSIVAGSVLALMVSACGTATGTAVGSGAGAAVGAIFDITKHNND
jgi:hypothetical protein